MKTSLFVAVAVAASAFFHGASAQAQAAGQHGVFKTSLTIPVVHVDGSNPNVDKAVTKTLVTNDIINLFLGRALGTKVDPKVDGVLAVDVTFEDKNGATPPVSRLVLYDPLVGGAGGVKGEIGVVSEMKFTTGYFGSTTKGFAVGKGTFKPTPAGNGDPSKNAILAGDLALGGSGGGPHIFDKQANVTTASSATMTGTFKFRFTDKKGVTTDWDGFVLKGAGKVTGKQIGNYIVP